MYFPSSIKDSNSATATKQDLRQTDSDLAVLIGALEHLSLSLLVRIRVNVQYNIIKGAAFAFKQQDLLDLYMQQLKSSDLSYIYMPLDHWQWLNIYV